MRRTSAAAAQPATSDAGAARGAPAWTSQKPNRPPDDAQPVRVVRAPAAAVAPEEPVEPVAERVTEAPAPVAPKATPQPKPRKRPSGRATCKKGMGLVRTSQGAVCVDRYDIPTTFAARRRGTLTPTKLRRCALKRASGSAANVSGSQPAQARAVRAFLMGAVSSPVAATRSRTVVMRRSHRSSIRNAAQVPVFMPWPATWPSGQRPRRALRSRAVVTHMEALSLGVVDASRRALGSPNQSSGFAAAPIRPMSSGRGEG